MKIKTYLILTAVLFLICSINPARCENSDMTEIVPAEEWSWARGAYNTFSGKIDLSGCKGDLIIRISADLPYNSETEKQSLPVFTSVNGKRIVMTKQSDSVLFKADAENNSMTFSASFRLPEKQHVSSILFTFIIQDENGTEIKRLTGRIESTEDGEARKDNLFYISADIRMITFVIAALAVLVWIMALIGKVRGNIKRRTGE